MFYVVAYDITNDKRRNKLFKAMKGFGIHTQFSVFECTLDDKEFDRMIDKITKVIDNKDDDIKINNRIISKDDFDEIQDEGVRLKSDILKKYFVAFEGKIRENTTNADN